MDSNQRIDPERFSIIPRTLCFLFHGDSVLLLRYSRSKGVWAGKLNGIGGHIEKGESVFQNACREVFEETGLRLHSMHLCGTILINTREKHGVGLYVLAADLPGNSPPEPSSSTEGTPEWFPLSNLQGLNLMPNAPVLIEKSLQALRNGCPPFSGLYMLDSSDDITVHFDVMTE